MKIILVVALVALSLTGVSSKCGTGFANKDSAKAEKCDSNAASCTTTKCCQAAKCSTATVTCGAGKFKDSAKNDADAGATDAEKVTNCCTAVAVCTAHTCGAGKKAIAAAATTKCTSNAASCTDALCCEADNTKCLDQKVSCGTDKFQDSAKNGVTAGADSTAHVTNCCTAKAVCTAHTCGANKKAIAAAATTKCTGLAATCTDALCCENDDTKCVHTNVSCGADKYKDTAKDGQTAGSALDNSHVTNCCTAKAVCTAHTCGANKKAIGAAATTKCPTNAASCTDALCCEDDTTKCEHTKVTCGADKFQDSAKHGATAGADAAAHVTNCCTAKAVCTAHTCGTGKKAIAAAATTKCIGLAASCTDALCCENDTTKCAHTTVTCGADKYKDASKNGVTAGAAAADHVTNCCTAKETCTEFWAIQTDAKDKEVLSSGIRPIPAIAAASILAVAMAALS